MTENKQFDQTVTISLVANISDQCTLTNSEIVNGALSHLRERSRVLDITLVRDSGTPDESSVFVGVDLSRSHGFILIHEGNVIAHGLHPMHYDDSDLDSLELREFNSTELYGQFLTLDNDDESTLEFAIENSGIYLS